MKRAFTLVALSASMVLLGGAENRGESGPALSVVADDDRIPTLSYRSLGGIAPNLHLECVLENDTGRAFSYEARANHAPLHVIERLREGRWRQTGQVQAKDGFTRQELPPGGTSRFLVDLSGVQTPFRIRVDLHGDGDRGPLSIVGREIRVPTKGPPRFEDVPLMLCGLVTLNRIHVVEPTWPEVARRAHMEGAVVVEVVVGRSGRVTETRLLKGAPLFVRGAIEAVKQWRYEPPRDHRGRPVAVYFPVTVKFEMKPSSGSRRSR